MNKDENRLFFRHGTGSLSIIFMVQQNIGKAKSSIILDNNKMKVMKVYYDSKLARLLTFMGSFDTMMLFGTIVTEAGRLDGRVLKHEETHVRQYWDCFNTGCIIAIAALFACLAAGAVSWWLLAWLAVPLLLYYALYGAEYAWWRLRGCNREDAYMKTGFERQAYWVEQTWDLPEEAQNQYKRFGWWNVPD